MITSQPERADLLKRWVQPSSNSEQDRMERAERMIRNAVDKHPPFDGYRDTFRVYPKGSYANKTNVRLDSDVDIVVENHGSFFSEYLHGVEPTPDPSWSPYTGPWTPTEWRKEVTAAISNYFGSGDVDTSGEVAITVSEKPGSRPSADVVPSFLYYRYDDAHRTVTHKGSKVFKKSGGSIVNYPEQQLANGNTKDLWTGGRYKQFARALKNAENTLVDEGIIKAKPSYFMECLVFNVPDTVLKTGWDLDTGFRETLYWLYQHLNSEYREEDWEEPNRLKYLFRGHQKWTVGDGRELVLATWDYLNYTNV